MGCLLLVSCYPGDGQRDSQEVEGSPDVVIPGEGPEQLHHRGQVLLSTRQREDKNIRGAAPITPCHSLSVPFQGSRSFSSWTHEPGSWAGLGLGALDKWAAWGRSPGLSAKNDLPSLHGGPLFPLSPGILQQTDEHACSTVVRLRKAMLGLGRCSIPTLCLFCSLPWPRSLLCSRVRQRGNGLQVKPRDLRPQLHTCLNLICGLWQVGIQPWALASKTADGAGPASGGCGQTVYA